MKHETKRSAKMRGWSRASCCQHGLCLSVRTANGSGGGDGGGVGGAAVGGGGGGGSGRQVVLHLLPTHRS